MQVAGENAKIGFPETKLAIIPGAGGTQRLSRLVGPAKAKELIFTGKILSSQESFNYGLVNASVAGSSLDLAFEMAKQISKNGPVGVQMAKQAIDKGLDVGLSQGLDIEKACYQNVINTVDRLEGLRAFLMKRDPIYIGK